MEKDITLFLDLNKEYEKVKPWIQENSFIIDKISEDKSEGIVSCYIYGERLKMYDIVEISWLLDNNINFCPRYFGSVDTIKSLGLES